MPDRFESSLRKPDRASKLAAGLAAEVDAFWATGPCELEPAVSEKAGERRVRISYLSPPPRSLPIPQKTPHMWAVHELDRIDKHRVLLPAATALTRINLHGDSYELAVARKSPALTPARP